MPLKALCEQGHNMHGESRGLLQIRFPMEQIEAGRAVFGIGHDDLGPCVKEDAFFADFFGADRHFRVVFGGAVGRV